MRATMISAGLEALMFVRTARVFMSAGHVVGVGELLLDVGTRESFSMSSLFSVKCCSCIVFYEVFLNGFILGELLLGKSYLMSYSW